LFIFCKELDVNFFVNNLIEKDNYSIYLLYFSIVNNNNNKESFIAYRLYYNKKRLIIIEIFLLFKVANYLLSLVLYYLIIDLLLKSINLLVLKNIFIFKYYYNNLDAIFLIRLYFIVLS